MTPLTEREGTSICYDILTVLLRYCIFQVGGGATVRYKRGREGLRYVLGLHNE